MTDRPPSTPWPPRQRCKNSVPRFRRHHPPTAEDPHFPHGKIGFRRYDSAAVEAVKVGGWDQRTRTSLPWKTARAPGSGQRVQHWAVTASRAGRTTHFCPCQHHCGKQRRRLRFRRSTPAVLPHPAGPLGPRSPKVPNDFLRHCPRALWSSKGGSSQALAARRTAAGHMCRGLAQSTQSTQLTQLRKTLAERLQRGRRFASRRCSSGCSLRPRPRRRRRSSGPGIGQVARATARSQ